MDRGRIYGIRMRQAYPELSGEILFLFEIEKKRHVSFGKFRSNNCGQECRYPSPELNVITR